MFMQQSIPESLTLAEYKLDRCHINQSCMILISQLGLVKVCKLFDSHCSILCKDRPWAWCLRCIARRKSTELGRLLRSRTPKNDATLIIQ